MFACTTVFLKDSICHCSSHSFSLHCHFPPSSWKLFSFCVLICALQPEAPVSLHLYLRAVFPRFSLSVNISPIRRCCGNIGDTGLEDVKHCDALRGVSGKFTFKQKPSVFLILARSAHGLVRIQRLLLVK